MAIVQPDRTWRVHPVFEEVWCPCCGSEDFTLLAGSGLWCERCNTHATVREPGGDLGYIVDFESDGSIWTRDAEQTIRGSMFVKLLGSKEPEIYYWSEPTYMEDGRGHRVDDWSPVTRDSEHDAPDERPIRETVALGTVEAGHYVDGYHGRSCDRCGETSYTGVSRSRDDWDRIEVVRCDGCGKLFDAVEQ